MKGLNLSNKHKNKHSVAKAMLFVFVLLGSVGAYIAHFGRSNESQLNPKGLVAAQQAHLMYLSAAIVLVVIVPTLLLLYFMAWKYRASNSKASYRSETRNTKPFVFTIWAIPTAAMVLLAIILIPVTHKMDPKNQAANGRTPITIQVVALRWKWLFLYPEQQIATVNTITIPKDQPVNFELTADDTPMSSFWIPNLAGQLYAMTGHVNRLSVVASDIGAYPGRSAEINGPGFADMRFTAHVTSEQDFQHWVNQVKATSGQLDQAGYDSLSKPTEDQPPSNYSTYAPDLYNNIIMKYMASPHMHMDGME